MNSPEWHRTRGLAGAAANTAPLRRIPQAGARDQNQDALRHAGVEKRSSITRGTDEIGEDRIEERRAGTEARYDQAHRQAPFVGEPFQGNGQGAAVGEGHA